ncbi:hypothetical protein F5B20DRAFT_395436 [Whalleya microplaca]|nr:hypothetical protein F5B20DRAFT_395436 [Whalleya microplaca]
MAISDHMNGIVGAHDSAKRGVNLQSQAPVTPPTSNMGQNSSDETISWNSSPSCSCMHDAVRVIQQLDDDEFHITSLSLDQVLQLQKWIIAQCCKPMECTNCVCLPSVHTVLLIICDRLAEMFECIHKRIKRANTALSEQGSLQNALTPPEGDVPSYTVDTRAQLFCNSSGLAASSATCNLQLFSPEFRSQYSDEEQVHMVRVLLKLQARNFRKLLARVDTANQISGSQARRSKVGAMVTRLVKANTDIEGALQAILQTLAGS